MPQVSVVIPTYKHADFVMEALGSVFAQTFTDYEIIVINDGSPDDTDALLKPLTEKGRIRYLLQSNAGQAAARNRGIALATGEFIALLDDDDVWPADHLQWMVDVLRTEPAAVVCYGQTENLGQGAQTRSPGQDGPSGDVFRRLIDRGWIRSPGQALIRRSALDSVGGFDPTIWGTDDWDLWLRLARLGPFAYRPRLALYYRLHETNASKNFFRMYCNGRSVIRKHFGRFPSPRHWSQRRTAYRMLRSFTCGGATAAIYQHKTAGRKREFVSSWWQFVQMKPSALVSRAFLKHLIWLILPLRAARMFEAKTSLTSRTH